MSTNQDLSVLEESFLEEAVLAFDNEHQLQTINELLESGADPNALSYLLQKVCSEYVADDDVAKATEVARLLLVHGASPNTGGGMTALCFATWRQQIDLIKLLVMFGADVNVKSQLHPPYAPGNKLTPLEYTADQSASFENPKGQEIVNFLETVDLQQKAPKIRVMISYCWADQTKAIALQKAIQDAGFDVWIDIENMSGSTTDAMSEAVESSDVVLCLISTGYQASSNCRLEFEYAHGLKKLTIPAKAESFTPCGWLALLLGKKLYFTLTDDKIQQEKEFPSIVKEICKVSSQAIVYQKPNNSTPAAPLFAAWDSADVTKWLNTNGFTDCEAEFAKAKVTGKELLTLKTLAQEPGRVSLFFDVLEKMGIQPIGRALALISKIKQL